MDLFWVNGWLFVHDACEGTGKVYWPTGVPTLPIAARYGGPDDFWPSLEMASAYYCRHSPAEVDAGPKKSIIQTLVEATGAKHKGPAPEAIGAIPFRNA